VVTRDQVLTCLDEVKDPEVPVLSVVELGVVRDAQVADDGGVTVTVTPTYSGCPAMRVIEESIEEALRRRGAPRVTVQTVYSPAWTTDWIPAAAKAKLEAYGIAPPGARVESDELVPLRRAVATLRCPWCKSTRTTLRSAFGSTACKALWWCDECRQPFEHFKAI
jgi:ring-1,2-phenylacetyl-CoA epoxidase subunit PaaD